MFTRSFTILNEMIKIHVSKINAETKAMRRKIMLLE